MKIKMILSENFIRFMGMLDVLFVFFQENFGRYTVARLSDCNSYVWHSK